MAPNATTLPPLPDSESPTQISKLTNWVSIVEDVDDANINRQDLKYKSWSENPCGLKIDTKIENNSEIDFQTEFQTKLQTEITNNKAAPDSKIWRTLSSTFLSNHMKSKWDQGDGEDHYARSNGNPPNTGQLLTIDNNMRNPPQDSPFSWSSTPVTPTKVSNNSFDFNDNDGSIFNNKTNCLSRDSIESVSTIRATLDSATYPADNNRNNKRSSFFQTNPSSSAPSPPSVHHHRSPSSRKTKGSATSRRTKLEFSDDFRILDSEYTKFISKSGVNRANVLRLALLPFLREQRSQTDSRSLAFEDLSKRTKILTKWWTGIILCLRDKVHPVAGSDRSAYLEGISGIMARTEWIAFSKASSNSRFHHNINNYEALLYDTVCLVISKLCLKTVALPFAAFSGKVLAYAFFWAPGIAESLLYLLTVNQALINNVVKVSFQDVLDGPNLSEAAKLTKGSFPDHLINLVGNKQSFVDSPRPLGPGAHVPGIYGSWARRWASFNSDVFFAFLKHYYSIISSLLPVDLPWNAHLTSPGLITIHAFLLTGFDSVVNPRKDNNISAKIGNEFLPDAVAAVNVFTPYRRRVDQLKSLALIREILHNDDTCIPFYEAYCRQFEHILHAVALRTSLYNTDNCIILTDLVEEFLSSLTLTNSRTKHRMQIQKDNVIDWGFWIKVVQRMLLCENTHTQLRALAFLFNIWDCIPIANTGKMSNNHSYPAMSPDTSIAYDVDIFDLYFDDQEGLRWNCTTWLLSPELWKRYFCHWQPLIRAYYLRLLCWRVASVGTESGFISSVLFSNYNSDVRSLLSRRLSYSFQRFQAIYKVAVDDGLTPPSSSPAPPIVNRKLVIMPNPAANSGFPTLNPLDHRKSLQDSINTFPISPTGSPSLNNINLFGTMSPTLSTRNDPDTSLPGQLSPLFPFSPTGQMSPSVFVLPDSSNSGASKAVSNNIPPLRRVHPYDVFDDIAYSYPTISPPSDLLMPKSRVSGDTANVVRRRSSRSASTSMIEAFGMSLKKSWYSSRLKRYFSTSTPSTPSSAVVANQNSSKHEEAQFFPEIHSLSTESKSSLSSSSSLTPVSGASSISTPPSPRSIASAFRKRDSIVSLYAPVDTSSPISNSISSTSLTMSLIPPPPQILFKRPEITRPAFKFGLEYCELGVRKQQNLIKRKNTRKHNVPMSVDEMTVNLGRLDLSWELELRAPRLPFDYDHMTIDMEAEDNTSQVTSVLNLYEESEFDLPEIETSSITFDYTDITSHGRTESLAPESLKLGTSPSIPFLVESEFEYRDMPLEESTKLKKLDDTKHWKYAGRSIREWDIVVKEFEEYVRSRRLMNGIIRLEDLGIPFLIAEIPSRLAG